MKPKAQRIAIAESCGWISHVGNSQIRYWRPPQARLSRDVHQLPDYCNDLNAMHEAEKMLYGDPNLPKKYTQQIKKAIRREAGVTKAQMDFDMCITATAAQRAEAFFRTIRKWTTNPNKEP